MTAAAGGVSVQEALPGCTALLVRHIKRRTGLLLALSSRKWENPICKPMTGPKLSKLAKQKPDNSRHTPLPYQGFNVVLLLRYAYCGEYLPPAEKNNK